MTAILLLLWIGFPVLNADLGENVRAYWDALQRADKDAAAGFVEESSRGHFLKRSEPTFRSWELTQIRMLDPETARVSVSMERWIGSTWFPWKTEEEWVRSAGGWRVRISDGVQARRALFRKKQEPLPVEGKVSVFPDEIRFHALSRRTPRTILLLNGTREPVGIEGLEFDRQLFSVEVPPGQAAAGEGVRLVVRYLGSEEAKEGTSKIAFAVRAGEESQSFEIPVAYNHVSPAARILPGPGAGDVSELLSRKAVPGARPVPRKRPE